MPIFTHFQTSFAMKSALLILVVAVSVTYGLYLNSYDGKNRQIYHELAKLFDQMSAKVRRCVNVLDEKCINGAIVGAPNDEDWLHNNSPGKRCANVYDQGCINGGGMGGGPDHDWITGGGTPGRR